MSSVFRFSAQCGFQDISYFTKTFREAMKCTPARYRLKNHTTPDQFSDLLLWRDASYSRIEAATAAFRDSTFPHMGILI
ncbi:MAG: AraC family transcriptional regulator [Candidatus Limivivens sp.]|nr:AraC family transcriptional regulator [Candidatus Limivivens sp.]